MAHRFIGSENDDREGRVQRGNSVLGDGFTRNATRHITKVYFRDLRRKKDIVLPYVPNKLNEDIAVKWIRHNVVGGSHSPLHYVGTENHMFNAVEFFFKAETPEQLRQISTGREDLMMLCYPAGSQTDIDRGAPSRILFIWPNFISMTCVISKLSITHERFSHQGQPLQFRAIISFEEIRDTRLGSEDILGVGTQRVRLNGSGDPVDPNLDFF